jgi:N-methylhydantoinase B/oxoprolinase/acetone carboxylase alpha subunit
MWEKWRRDWSEFDPSRIFAKDSIVEWFQMAEAKKRGFNLKLARIEAKMTQLQAMKALVRELPKFTTQKKSSNNAEEIMDATTKFQWEAIKTLATKAQKVEDKGKGKVQEVEDKDKSKAKVIEVEDDDWGDDELLFDFDSDY